MPNRNSPTTERANRLAGVLTIVHPTIIHKAQRIPSCPTAEYSLAGDRTGASIGERCRHDLCREQEIRRRIDSNFDRKRRGNTYSAETRIDLDTAALKVEVQVLAELNFREAFPVSGLKGAVLPLCAFGARTFVMIEWGETLY